MANGNGRNRKRKRVQDESPAFERAGPRVAFFEEVFGRDSRYFSSFTMLTWRREQSFVVGGIRDPEASINPQPAIDREHHKAYLEQLDTARGLLIAAKDELERKGLDGVYQGKERIRVPYSQKSQTH